MDNQNGNTHAEFGIPRVNVPDSRSRSLFVRAFIGPFGLRSGWRFFLFFIIATCPIVAVTLGLQKWLGPFSTDITALLNEAVSVLCVLGATWIMARIDRKPLLSFGLVSLHRSRNLLIGIATGFFSLSLLIGLLIATGGFHLGPVSLHGRSLVTWGLFWMVVFICVGVTEELLTRGYPLFALTQGLGFWPAAILLSLLFGAAHSGTKGEDYIGVGAAVLVGIILAFSLKWSGSLWWAIGYHFAWDWAQTFFYGVPDSGHPSVQHFLSGVCRWTQLAFRRQSRSRRQYSRPSRTWLDPARVTAYGPTNSSSRIAALPHALGHRCRRRRVFRGEFI